MSSDILTQYQRLKQDVEKRQHEQDQARGVLKQLLSQLKSEYNCASLEEAERLYQSMQESLDKDEQEFSRLLKAYKQAIDNA